MIIIFWTLEAFLFLMGLVCIKAMFFPETHAKWTLERVKAEMKFYGFEGDIKATERSVKIIQNGHRLALILVMIFMASLRFFLG